MTAVSGRLPKERIIAVEMLRGPDHMAIRVMRNHILAGAMTRASRTCLLLASVFTVTAYAQTPERELAAYGQELAVYQQDLLRAARNLRKRSDADSLAAAALFSVRSDPADALRLIGQARSAVARPAGTHLAACPDLHAVGRL